MDNNYCEICDEALISDADLLTGLCDNCRGVTDEDSAFIPDSLLSNDIEDFEQDFDFVDMGGES